MSGTFQQLECLTDSYSANHLEENGSHKDFQLTKKPAISSQEYSLKHSFSVCEHPARWYFEQYEHCQLCGLLLSLKVLSTQVNLCAQKGDEVKRVHVLRDQAMCHEPDIAPGEVLACLYKDELAMDYKTHVELDDQNYKVKRMLIDWMFELGEKFYQDNLTIHIAIAYLDRIYSLGLHQNSPVSTPKSQEEMRILALAAFVLASKYDELDDRIPFDCNLADSVRHLVDLKPDEIVERERQILFAFNFELAVVTPLHFVRQMCAQGVVFNYKDRLQEGGGGQGSKITLFKQGNKKCLTSNNFLYAIRQFSEFFADLSTQLYSLRRFKPSLVALACVLCARKNQGVVPVWSQYFALVTPYSSEQVEEPFQMLYRFYLGSFGKKAPESEGKFTQSSTIQSIKYNSSLERKSSVHLNKQTIVNKAQKYRKHSNKENRSHLALQTMNNNKSESHDLSRFPDSSRFNSKSIKVCSFPSKLSLSRSVSNIQMSRVSHQRAKEEGKRVFQLNLKQINESNEGQGATTKKQQMQSLMVANQHKLGLGGGGKGTMNKESDKENLGVTAEMAKNEIKSKQQVICSAYSTASNFAINSNLGSRKKSNAFPEIDKSQKCKPLPLNPRHEYFDKVAKKPQAKSLSKSPGNHSGEPFRILNFNKKKSLQDKLKVKYPLKNKSGSRVDIQQGEPIESKKQELIKSLMSHSYSLQSFFQANKKALVQQQQQQKSMQHEQVVQNLTNFSVNEAYFNQAHHEYKNDRRMNKKAQSRENFFQAHSVKSLQQKEYMQGKRMYERNQSSHENSQISSSHLAYFQDRSLSKYGGDLHNTSQSNLIKRKNSQSIQQYRSTSQQRNNSKPEAKISSKRSKKVIPKINEQVLEATKQRILSVLSSKISIQQQQQQQSLQQSYHPYEYGQIPEKQSQKHLFGIKEKMLLSHSSLGNLKTLAGKDQQKSSRVSTQPIKGDISQVPKKNRGTRAKMNSNHHILIKPCPSSHHLYVVDEEEKINNICQAIGPVSKGIKIEDRCKKLN